MNYTISSAALAIIMTGFCSTHIRVRGPRHIFISFRSGPSEISVTGLSEIPVGHGLGISAAFKAYSAKNSKSYRNGKY